MHSSIPCDLDKHFLCNTDRVSSTTLSAGVSITGRQDALLRVENNRGSNNTTHDDVIQIMRNAPGPLNSPHK